MYVAEAAGGIDRYLRGLFKYSDRSIFENIFVCSQKFKEKHYRDLVDVFCTLPMVHTISRHDLWTVIGLRKLIKAYRPDIIYAHSSKAGAIVRGANLGFRNLCIYNPHGWAFHMYGPHTNRRLYRWLERIMAPFADHIVCISEPERRAALQRHICRPDKLSVIYNGIDLEEYEDIRSTKEGMIRRSALAIPETAVVVGMVGRLAFQKGPDIFMRMAKRLLADIPNIYFVMVGDGEMRRETEEYARLHGFADRLRITGWVENPLAYMGMFDVAVLLSRWEGFGLVLPEYMLCGKPIVATQVDAIPTVLTDHTDSILVPPEDPQAAAEAVGRLLQQDKRSAIDIVKSRMKVAEKYNMQRTVRQHEALFLQLLKGKGGGGPL